MTHIENIPHILQYGVTHKDSKNANPSYKSIGDNSLIKTRAQVFEGQLGNSIGEYTPFYFGPRTPMLYVIAKGFNGVEAVNQEEIVYLVSDIQLILNTTINFLFTDGHATDRFTSFFGSDQVFDIHNKVDFKAARAKYWKSEEDLDLKRRKEAEFLVKEDIPIESIKQIIVFNKGAKVRLMALGVEEKLVQIHREYYF